MRADEDAPAPEQAQHAADAAAGIEAALRGLHGEGRAGLQAAGDVARALQQLLVADLALARSALLRALACIVIALVFGTSCWLLLMAALVAALQASGLSWLAALLIAALLSLTAAALAVWGAMRHLAHTRLDASRRQLARLLPRRRETDVQT